MSLKKKYAYCMTINNPIYADYEAIKAFDKSEDRAFMVVGHENFRERTFMEKKQGKKLTPHLQMFVVCNREMSFFEMKEWFPRAHIEVARKFYEGFFYCLKDGYFEVTGNVTNAWSKWLIQSEESAKYLASKKRKGTTGDGVSVTPSPSGAPSDDSEPFSWRQWEYDRLLVRDEGPGYWND